MSIETEPTAGESITSAVSASARKKTAAAKPKGAPALKTRKAAGRPLQSSRAKPKGEKLICRYCGSDDLVPSFRKRRDARCRACFKKRYGSAARNQKAVRTRTRFPHVRPHAIGAMPIGGSERSGAGLRSSFGHKECRIRFPSGRVRAMCAEDGRNAKVAAREGESR